MAEVIERLLGQVATTRNFIIGTMLLVSSIVAGYALLVQDRALYNRLAPAEGRFWMAAQYLRSAAKVRQYVYDYTLLAPGPERDYADAMAKRWTNNLRTEHEVLVNSAELKAFMEIIPEYRKVRPLTQKLDDEIEDLVARAKVDHQGLLVLRERLEEVDSEVGKLATRLRVLDQDDLTISLKALQRGVQMQYVGAAVVLVAMWVAVMFSRSATRKAKHGQVQTELAMDAVRDANDEVQQTLQARTALLGMVSHELRTPLSKIVAATELIDIVAHGDGVNEATAQLYAAVETMTQQLTDLTTYAELTSSRSRARAAELDIRTALAGIVRAEAAHIRAHGLEVRYNVAPNVPERLPIDAIRVGQVATNLINNAIKYTREGMVSIDVRLLPGPPGEPERLEMVVADTGQGIAVAEQELVWEPFFRSSERGSEPGSGLGLAVVKLAVDKLGGVVRFVSAPGEGTQFTVEIPLSPVEPAPANGGSRR